MVATVRPGRFLVMISAPRGQARVEAECRTSANERTKARLGAGDWTYSSITKSLAIRLHKLLRTAKAFAAS